MINKLPIIARHESQRGYFAHELHEIMRKDDRVVLITADLGYLMFDAIKRDFPGRFINVEAAEQLALGVAVGYAMEGYKPIVYSITPFLLYRPYEWLRNYLNAELYSVMLVGSGRDKDYLADGLTHWAEEAKGVLETLPNIETYWPETNEDVVKCLRDALEKGGPSFVSLRR